MKLEISRSQRALWLGRKASRVNFALVFRLHGAFPDEHFRMAIARVIQSHSLFSIRLVEEGYGQLVCTTDGVPEIPLNIIPCSDERGWINVAKTELDRPFNYQTGPLVRFVLLQNSAFQDLIVVCDHGVSDGLSAVYLVRDLLCQLSDPDREISPLPVPPDIWALVPQAVERSRDVEIKLAIFAKWFQLSHFVWRTQKQPVQTLIPHLPRYSILSTQFTQTQTQHLLERCRKEQTTVQAALSTSWALAQLRLQKNKRKERIKVSVPVSLRDRLPDTLHETTGFFISTVEVPVIFPPGGNFWDIARMFKNEFARNTNDKSLFLGPLMAKTMFSQLAGTEDEQFIQTFINHHIQYDFSVTNLGRLNIPTQYGSFHIGAVYGPIVNAYEKEKTIGICTIDGLMTMTFTFQESQLSKGKAEEMLDQAVNILAQQM